MIEILYPLIAHRWGGVIVAVFLVLAGVFLLSWARRSKSPHRGLGKLLAWIVCGGAGLVLVGALVSVAIVAYHGSRHPAPGERIDVGGYRMHILAEGDDRGGPSVVWIPGAHSQGLAMYHLHSALRGEARSILFDRPGTGWSDPGPFPRRTSVEAVELARLLERADEKGPFVVVGNSYGGLLAANFARRYPAQIAAVVLLNASPPDAFVYAPAYGAGELCDLARRAEREGLAKLVGVWRNRDDAIAESDTEPGELLRRQRTLLADVNDAMAANRRRPATSFAEASIFREFGAGKVTQTAPDLVVYDGELGDLPVLVVVPGEGAAGLVEPLGLDEAAATRARNFFERARVRYLDVSSDARLVHSPPGTGHHFPYEAPEFVVELVRGLLEELRGGGATGR